MATSGYTENRTSNSLEAVESSITDELISPEARFECPICLAWLRDPVVTSCGHRFCRNCILSWLDRENASCPIDNTKLSAECDIYPDNFTRREISNQRTPCPNITRGCSEQLAPLDIETHLLTCPHRPAATAAEVVPLPDNEQLRCRFVLVGCRQTFQDEPELQRHLDVDVQGHLLLLSTAYNNFTISQSAATATTSTIAEQAHFWDPPSKSGDHHQKSSLLDSSSYSNQESVQNLIRALYEKIIILEQKSREQDIIIANMSEQINSSHLTISSLQLRNCSGCYLWCLQDFREKLSAMYSTKQMFYSAGFYTSFNGYKLCLRVNISPRDSNYLAVLIHMMKSDHDNTLEWPFSGRITVMLIHPQLTDRNIKETMMSRPEIAAFQRPTTDFNPTGFGYTEFAAIEDVRTLGYLSNNNQLLIKAMVQPV